MKVFITHSHGNRPLVWQIVKTLKQSGLDVWDDEYDTYPSGNWYKVTGEALERSDVLVVLVTPDALDSDIVHKDIGFALTNIQFKYRVIPVLVGVDLTVAKEHFGWIMSHLDVITIPTCEGQKEGIEQITQALYGLQAAA